MNNASTTNRRRGDWATSPTTRINLAAPRDQAAHCFQPKGGVVIAMYAPALLKAHCLPSSM